MEETEEDALGVAEKDFCDELLADTLLLLIVFLAFVDATTTGESLLDLFEAETSLSDFGTKDSSFTFFGLDNFTVYNTNLQTSSQFIYESGRRIN